MAAFLFLMKLADDGSLTTGPDPKENRKFYSYGAEVLAVADGTVLNILDGVPENSPFSREMPIPMTREKMPGNPIILALGFQRFAFYAHLRPGSFLVKVGDLVKKGQPLARLGNSGRSDAPHLHFHIADSEDLYAADGRPFVLEAFDGIGSRDLLEMINNSSAAWSPGPVPPRRCVEEMPKSDPVVRLHDRPALVFNAFAVGRMPLPRTRSRICQLNIRNATSSLSSSGMVLGDLVSPQSAVRKQGHGKTHFA